MAINMDFWRNEADISDYSNLIMVVIAWSIAISHLSTGLQALLTPTVHVPAFKLWAAHLPRTPFSDATNHYFLISRNIFLGVLYAYTLLNTDEPLKTVFFLNSCWGVGESALTLIAVLLQGPRWRRKESVYALVSSFVWFGFVLYWCRVEWNWPAFVFAIAFSVHASLQVVLKPGAHQRR